QGLVIPSRPYRLRRRPDAEERIQGRHERLRDRRVGGRERNGGRRYAQGRESLVAEACSRDRQPCPEAQGEVRLPSRRNRKVFLPRPHQGSHRGGSGGRLHCSRRGRRSMCMPLPNSRMPEHAVEL
ncbi:unnamed protein product, partial [Ectocarpus sp. 12 AP-2014]